MLKTIVAVLVSNRALKMLSNFLSGVGVPQEMRMAIYVVLGAALLLGAMWYYQESILYRPEVPTGLGSSIKTVDQNPQGMRSPSESGLKHEEVELVASDGVRLHAWFIPAETDAHTAPTLLFSHENAGNMGLRLMEFVGLHRRVRCNIMLYDYRGYGNSQTATIDEAGLMCDARAAWAWLLQRGKEGKLDARKLVLYGRSLGGAVTIQLARELCDAAAGSGGSGGPVGVVGVVVPAGVIVGNTFTSIEGLLGSVYPFLNFGFVKKYLLRLQWRSVEHIAKVTAPILMFVGRKDEIVPSGHTDQLRQAAVSAPEVTMHEVADGTHNDTWLKAGPLYFEWLQTFLDRHASGERHAATGGAPREGKKEQ